MKINDFNTDSHVENLISKSLSLGRFPHTVIIEGGTGDERLSLAKKIARALICTDKDERPCGSCSHCKKSSHDVHPDILFKSPKKNTSGNLVYTVDDIRDIRSEAFIIPNEADKKVVILSDANLMNINGQNAFLKILEEPPEFVSFILLCPSKSVFITTVLSRATVFSLGVCNEFGGEFEESQLIACSEKMINAIATGDPYEAVKAAGQFDKNQKLLSASLPVMADMLASALRIKCDADEENGYECSRNAANKMSLSSLLRAFDGVNEIISSLNSNANLNLTLVRLCALLRQK